MSHYTSTRVSRLSLYILGLFWLERLVESLFSVWSATLAVGWHCASYAVALGVVVAYFFI